MILKGINLYDMISGKVKFAFAIVLANCWLWHVNPQRFISTVYLYVKYRQYLAHVQQCWLRYSRTDARLCINTPIFWCVEEKCDQNVILNSWYDRLRCRKFSVLVGRASMEAAWMLYDAYVDGITITGEGDMLLPLMPIQCKLWGELWTVC